MILLEVVMLLSAIAGTLAIVKAPVVPSTVPEKMSVSPSFQAAKSAWIV